MSIKTGKYPTAEVIDIFKVFDGRGGDNKLAYVTHEGRAVAEKLAAVCGGGSVQKSAGLVLDGMVVGEILPIELTPGKDISEVIKNAKAEVLKRLTPVERKLLDL